MSAADPLILISRPRESSLRFAESLSGRHRGEVLVAPLIEIVPVGSKVSTSGYETVVFTSVNAIGRTLGSIGKTTYVVGGRTAEEAQSAGFKVKGAAPNVARLLDMLAEERPGTPILHVRGERTTGDLAGCLRRRGVPADEVITYRQANVPLSKNELAKVDEAEEIILTAFSPHGATRLLQELPELQNATLVAISDAAARAWFGRSVRILVAREPTAQSMTETLLELLEADSSC